VWQSSKSDAESIIMKFLLTPSLVNSLQQGVGSFGFVAMVITQVCGVNVAGVFACLCAHVNIV